MADAQEIEIHCQEMALGRHFVCTEPALHSGDHVATARRRDGSPYEVFRWANDGRRAAELLAHPGAPHPGDKLIVTGVGGGAITVSNGFEVWPPPGLIFFLSMVEPGMVRCGSLEGTRVPISGLPFRVWRRSAFSTMSYEEALRMPPEYYQSGGGRMALYRPVEDEDADPASDGGP